MTYHGTETGRFRHVKRGTYYTVRGRASLQCAPSRLLTEGAELVIYEGEKGGLWARPADEFFDGRFERDCAQDIRDMQRAEALALLRALAIPDLAQSIEGELKKHAREFLAAIDQKDRT